MKINIQDFCNHHGLLTDSTVKSGVKKTADREGLKYNYNYNPSKLYYSTSTFTSLNKTAVIRVLKTFDKK